MIASTEEQDRPQEWVQRIVEGRQYRELVDDAGSLAIAAYRLARAVCRTRPIATNVPTLRELVAAAEEIARECDLRRPLPDTLRDACDERGLLVIEPVSPGRRSSRVAEPAIHVF